MEDKRSVSLKNFLQQIKSMWKSLRIRGRIQQRPDTGQRKVPSYCETPCNTMWKASDSTFIFIWIPHFSILSEVKYFNKCFHLQVLRLFGEGIQSWFTPELRVYTGTHLRTTTHEARCSFGPGSSLLITSNYLTDEDLIVTAKVTAA